MSVGFYKAVDRVKYRSIGRPPNRFGSTGHISDHPRPYRPGPDGGSMIVPGPNQHLAAGRKTELVGQFGSHGAEYVEGLGHRWQEFRVDHCDPKECVRPLAFGDVPQHGRRGVGMVLTNLAGEPGGDHRNGR